MNTDDDPRRCPETNPDAGRWDSLARCVWRTGHDEPEQDWPHRDGRGSEWRTEGKQ